MRTLGFEWFMRWCHWVMLKPAEVRYTRRSESKKWNCVHQRKSTWNSAAFEIPLGNGWDLEEVTDWPVCSPGNHEGKNKWLTGHAHRLFRTPRLGICATLCFCKNWFLSLKASHLHWSLQTSWSFLSWERQRKAPATMRWCPEVKMTSPLFMRSGTEVFFITKVWKRSACVQILRNTHTQTLETLSFLYSGWQLHHFLEERARVREVQGKRE